MRASEDFLRTPKASLLSREKFAARREEMGEFPTIEIEKHGQVLYFFGANHSKDPKNPQYEILKDSWEKWLQKTDPSTRLVLVEGGKRDLQTNEEDSICISAEGGFITLLAHEAGSAIESPEPDDELLRSMMLTKHPLIDIALYEFLGTADSWSRMLPERRPDFRTYEMQTSRRKYHEGFSYEDLVSEFENKIGSPFDPEKVNQYCNPNRNETFINRVARTSSDIRDQYIAEQIISYWKDGKSLFVVFGSGHVVIEEPMLRASIK